jgi:hypothetical protein
MRANWSNVALPLFVTACAVTVCRSAPRPCWHSAAVAVPITLSSLNSASISATLLAKGTLMHLTVTATSTWVVAASLAATICVSGVVAGEVLARPAVSPPPVPLVVNPEPTPVPVLSDPKPVPVLSEWEKKLDEKLDQKLAFNFEDTDPTDLFNFLRKIAGINIIIHPKAEATMKATPITLNGKDVTARETLNKLMPMLHVRFMILDQAVFITSLPEDDQGVFEKTEKSLAEAEVVGAADQTDWGKIILSRLDQSVTLDFQDASLEDVVLFLRQTTGLTIILDPKALTDKSPTVTMKVEAMKLRFVLNHIMRLTNLRYQLENEAIFVTTPATQKQAQDPQLKPAESEVPITLKVEAMRATDVTGWISKLRGIPIRIDPKIQDQRLTLDFQDAELSDVLVFLAKVLDAEVKKLEDDVGGFHGYLLTPKVPAADQEPVVPAAAQ